MADEDNGTENPLTAIRERAEELGFERGSDEYDDYVTARMSRAGFKKGPGEWLRADEVDEDNEDDDEPMTRGDWRRIQREQKRKSVSAPPRRSETEGEGKEGKEGKGRNKGRTIPSIRRDPWW